MAWVDIVYTVYTAQILELEMEVKQRFEITFEALHISPPELLVLGPGRAAVVRGELHPQLRGGLLAGQLVQEVVTVPELSPQITEAVLVVLDIRYIIYSTRASSEGSRRFHNHRLSPG